MMSQRDTACTTIEESSLSEEEMSVTVQIVSAVADLEGVDATELDTPLYEAVDPDALAAITKADSETELTLSFNYAGYRVTVIVDEEPLIEVSER